MGNSIYGRTLFENVEEPKRVISLMFVKISQLQETYQYLLGSDIIRKQTINLDVFVDVFGCLMDDPEYHFADFRFPELPICDTMEVLCFLALFCCDPLRSKVEFLFNLHVHKRSNRMKGTGLYLLLRRIFSAISRVFRFEHIENSSIALLANNLLSAYVERMADKLSTDGPSPAVLAAEEKEDPLSYLITDNVVRFTFVEFYQYLQESHNACTFLDEVSAYCTESLANEPKWCILHPQLAIRDSLIVGGPREIVESKPPFEFKARHPLWSYNIVDIMQESWFSTTPIGRSDDHIFTILEHLVLSDRRALPIFVDIPVQHHHGGTSSTPHATLLTPSVTGNASGHHSKSPASKKSVPANTPQRAFPFNEAASLPNGSVSTQHSASFTPTNANSNMTPSSVPNHTKSKFHRPAGSHQSHFVGVIDFSTIVSWIAINIPESLTARTAADERKRREMARYQHELAIALSPTRGSMRSSSVQFSDVRSMSMSGHPPPLAKQDSIGKPIAVATMHWQSIGENIAAVTVKDAMLGILNNGFITDSAIGKHLRTALNPASHVGASVLSTGLKNRIEASKAQQDNCPVLQGDQFLYDIVLLIAQGHRSIPISFRADKPQTPNLVITDVEVVGFLRENAAEVMGSLAKVSVSKCDFMKSPICIKSSVNFGSALYTLACRNVDMAIVLDSNGKIGCRLSVDCVKRLWWTWKQQMDEGGNMNLAELKRLYEAGTYSVSNGSSGSVFSMFSCLLTPLRNCEDFGIHVVNFSKFVNDHQSDSEPENASQDSSEDDSEVEDRDPELASIDVFDEPGFRSPAGSPQSFSGSLSGRVSRPSSTVTSRAVSARSGMTATPDIPTDSEHPMTPKPPPGSARSKRSSSLTQSGKTTPLQSSRKLVRNVNSPNKSTTKAGSSKQKKSRQKKKKKAKKPISINEVERRKRLSSWFTEMGAVQITDTLNLALEAMHHVGSTRALVSNTEGEVVGVISIVNICRELLNQEAQLKSVQLSSILKGERTNNTLS